jgi:nicotinate-nucleotide adenylyltransferase
MGADNLRSFHRWQRWREITRLVPIAVIDRPQSTLKGAHSRTAAYLARWRLDEADGALMAERRAPGFIFLHGPRSDMSSTELRARGLGFAPVKG